MKSHLYDLLNGRKRLYAREDGKQQVCIVGLQEYEVDNVQTLLEIFDFGNNARSTGNCKCCLLLDWNWDSGYLLLVFFTHERAVVSFLRRNWGECGFF